MPSSDAVAAPPGPPSMDDVRQIAAMQDAIVRNLRITLAYHELALAIAARCGGAANWCTFATWASRQAGQTIRGEDLLAVLQERLRVPMRVAKPLQSLWRVLLRRGLLDPKTKLGGFVQAVQGPLDPLERASDAVARGNRKVFEEIGLEFARFMSTCGRDVTLIPRAWTTSAASCAKAIRPRGSASCVRPSGATTARSSRRERMCGRRRSISPISRSAGTSRRGCKRRSRKRSTVRRSRFVNWASTCWRRLAPGARNWYRVFYVPACMTLGVIALPLAAVARRLAREVITECLMILFVPPDRALRLGRDLTLAFPESLRQLSAEDVLAALGQLRCDVHHTHACGAEDWADLRERLHYIAHLFPRLLRGRGAVLAAVRRGSESPGSARVSYRPASCETRASSSAPSLASRRHPSRHRVVALVILPRRSPSFLARHHSCTALRRFVPTISAAA